MVFDAGARNFIDGIASKLKLFLESARLAAYALRKKGEFFEMSTTPTKLQAKLESGQKAYTAEVTPPKGSGIKKFLERTGELQNRMDAVNLTDCQRALVRMSSLAASKILIDEGLEPVFQLTCRDRNKIALQSDLMGAYALGIRNVLCLTGDPVKVGDCVSAKSVFDVEAIGLLGIVKRLQNGKDFEGHTLSARTRFYVGAVVNPTVASNSNQLARMEKKIEAGAEFFQTQANYDLEDYHAFLTKARPLRTKILAGILLLNSYEMAAFVNENLPGIRVPNHVLERFKNSSDPAQTGLDFAVETMKCVENVCDGFHLMSIRAEELIPKIMDNYHDQRQIIPNSPLSMSSPARS